MTQERHASFFLSASYFLFFAILGIFLPYFNLYCYYLKFSSTQIGILSASQSLMKLISPLLWAYLADQAWSRKKISLTTSLASAVIFVTCLFITNFKIMLISITLYGFFRTAIVPLMEATTWETIEAEGGEYGKIRLWGSVGFILTSFATGRILDIWPLKFVLYGISLLSFLLFLTTLKIPKEIPQEKSMKRQDHIFSLALKPSMPAFIMISTFMQISHGTYYGFFTIYMEGLGFSRSVIGLSWGLSVLCEIILMMRYQHWFGKTRPEAVLVLACFAATWRWWIMAYSHSLVFILFGQLLHAFTFGALHVASLTYLNQKVPPELRTSGQGLLSSVSYGLGGMIGLALSGFLYDSLGARRLFSLSSLFSFCAGMVALFHYFHALRQAQGQPSHH